MLTSQTIHRFAYRATLDFPKVEVSRKEKDQFLDAVQAIDPQFSKETIVSFVLSGEPTAAATAQELVDQLREFYGIDG